jgi:hypothetical protein
MQNLRQILENVFFTQENQTITLSFAGAEAQDDKSIYEIMEQMKGVLKSIGVDNVSYSPDTLSATVVTSDDKMDEVRQIAKDFGATVK